MRKVALLTAGLLLSAMVSSAHASTFNNLAAFLAAAGPTTLVNFDNGESGDILNDYAAQGVSFSAGNYYADCNQETSPPSCWINDASDGNNGRLFDATFLVGGITAVGVNSVLHGGLAILRAFDAGNNLLESVSSDNDSNTLDFFGLTTGAPIHHITIQFPAPVFGWALDDLRFSQQVAVPEPMSLLLVGAGVAGLRSIRRRRN